MHLSLPSFCSLSVPISRFGRSSFEICCAHSIYIYSATTFCQFLEQEIEMKWLFEQVRSSVHRDAFSTWEIDCTKASALLISRQTLSSTLTPQFCVQHSSLDAFKMHHYASSKTQTHTHTVILSIPFSRMVAENSLFSLGMRFTVPNTTYFATLQIIWTRGKQKMLHANISSWCLNTAKTKMLGQMQHENKSWPYFIYYIFIVFSFPVFNSLYIEHEISFVHWSGGEDVSFLSKNFADCENGGKWAQRTVRVHSLPWALLLFHLKICCVQIASIFFGSVFSFALLAVYCRTCFVWEKANQANYGMNKRVRVDLNECTEQKADFFLLPRWMQPEERPFLLVFFKKRDKVERWKWAQKKGFFAKVQTLKWYDLGQASSFIIRSKPLLRTQPLYEYVCITILVTTKCCIISMECVRNSWWLLL